MATFTDLMPPRLAGQQCSDCGKPSQAGQMVSVGPTRIGRYEATRRKNGASTERCLRADKHGGDHQWRGLPEQMPWGPLDPHVEH